MATIADVFKVYTKPSLDGLLVIRKRGVNRLSQRVLDRNRAFRGGQWAATCKGRPIKEFITCLRRQAGGG